MTQKFLAFAGSTYYPYGGAEDFVGKFDSIETAKIAIKYWLKMERGWDMDERTSYCWWHISDENFKILAQNTDEG